MHLHVPSLALDERPWPTLGPEVCDWIEAHLCYGPGDVLGMPVKLTDEFRLYLYRAYEVYPRGHQLEGRRRFKRCFLSRRKGVGKTELAAWVAIAELDPTAPVRCDGWRRDAGAWVPVGRPVRDPYIPMLAFTEDQAEELAYGAAKAVLENCDLGNLYDIGAQRIMHGRAPGKLVALSTAPSARDGARTTHQHIDEPHRWNKPRHWETHDTVLLNIPKRYASDAWTHETSTSPCPGEGSVAEKAHQLAEAIERGDVEDPRFLFDHRQASDKLDLTKRKQVLEAIREASGDAYGFADVESIAALLVDIKVDGPKFARFWLNIPSGTASRMFSLTQWDWLLERGRGVPKRNTRVVLAFDGAYSRDSTALVGITVEPNPYIFLVECWEKPLKQVDWHTDPLEVESTITRAMNYWRVLELACDPPGWHYEIEGWADTWGGDIVTRFETKQPAKMGPACDAFVQALRDGGGFTHDGNTDIRRHIGNCVPVERAGFTVPSKEHPDSPLRIDLATGTIFGLSRARWHALNSGDGGEPWVITS